MKMDTRYMLSPISVALHWLVGVVIIGLLGVGIYMAETQTYSLYPIHKSFGFVVFFIAIVRVLWRIKNGWPTPAGQYSVLEQWMSKVVHWVLIVATVMMPLSGFLMSSLGGSGVEVFGAEVVARNVLPDNPQRAVPHNEGLATFFGAMHFWTGWAMIVGIALHVAGAIKHKLIDKDGTLPRMLGANIEH